VPSASTGRKGSAANKGGRCGARTGHFSLVLKAKKQKRIPFLKNEPEKLLKTQDRPRKTNPNEPKNEAGKLLKICSCGKNEPKTNPGTKRAILLKTIDC
jgi:hypothetical protein